MAWIDEAEKHANKPTIIATFSFSTPLKFSIDEISPTTAAPVKGNILSLPNISYSLGRITRALQFPIANFIFDDTDYQFRTLFDPLNGEQKKGVAVQVDLYFQDKSMATTSLTIFKGQIQKWEPLPRLRFQISCEQKTSDLKNKYPEKKITATDYPNLADNAKNLYILEPYGTIAEDGKGAWFCPMIDTTIDAEQHLIGRQTAAITVSKVYINKVQMTEGVGNDYTIVTQVIDGFTHTEVHWNAAVNPTADDTVSADIEFGSRDVCEAWQHYNINFANYVLGDFDAVSYAAASTIAVDRDYIMNGVFEKNKELSAHRDDICNEFELEIYWDPKDGLIHFKFLTVEETASNTYVDYLDILKGYEPNTNVLKIMNHLDYGLKYNYVGEYYDDLDEVENAESIAEHGGTAFREFFGFKFTRDSAVATDLAARKVLRRKDPIILDEFPLPLKAFADNLAAILQITHYDGIGPDGYDEAYFQIRKVDYNLNNFTVKMILENMNNFFGHACRLGDATVLPQLWINGTVPQKLYCAACDPVTNLFSDGSPGMQLYN